MWDADDLMDQVVRKEDWDLANQLFSDIGYDDQAEYLVQDYWNLKEWPQRLILAYLLQAQTVYRDYEIDPGILWFDVLRAPVPEEGDDQVDFTKMSALAHLAERYDTMQRFYDDRELLHRTVDELLGQHGVTVEPPPPPRPVSDEAPPAGDPVAVLEHAVENGDLPAVQALLDAGLDVDCPISDRRSWANGVPVFILARLPAGKHSDGSLSPLTLAALKGHRPLVEALIERGADVTAPGDGQGRTALWYAAWYGWLPVVDALLERGAEPAAADRDGGTPLINAVERGHLDVIQRLLDAGAPLELHEAPLLVAARHGRTAVVEYLLSMGWDINGVQNDDGSYNSPLALACEMNHLDLVEMLLHRGAPVDARNSEGRTPLLLAAVSGFPTVMKRLLDAGADATAKDNDGRSAGDLAGGLRADGVRRLLARIG